MAKAFLVEAVLSPNNTSISSVPEVLQQLMSGCDCTEAGYPRAIFTRSSAFSSSLRCVAVSSYGSADPLESCLG